MVDALSYLLLESDPVQLSQKEQESRAVAGNPRDAAVIFDP